VGEQIIEHARAVELAVQLSGDGSSIQGRKDALRSAFRTASDALRDAETEFGEALAKKCDPKNPGLRWTAEQVEGCKRRRDAKLAELRPAAEQAKEQLDRWMEGYKRFVEMSQSLPSWLFMSPIPGWTFDPAKDRALLMMTGRR